MIILHDNRDPGTISGQRNGEDDYAAIDQLLKPGIYPEYVHPRIQQHDDLPNFILQYSLFLV